MPTRRLIGMEFETGPPHRCGVSFLGNEEEGKETEVRGQVLLDMFLGICWLHGFRASWILDSVTDIYNHEKMRYTMGVEKGMSFYENKGFLFSIDTIKQRSRPEPCLGFTDFASGRSGDSGGLEDLYVSGKCQVRRDLLQSPGFEPSVLYPLHEKAFSTLHQLVFDCRAAAWQNCSDGESSSGSPFPLLEKLPDGSCAFERHPLWQQLAELSPEHCGFAQRVGACHAYVRKHLGCTHTKKDGCPFLQFLYKAFIYPGGDPTQKIPTIVADRWDLIGRRVATQHGFRPRRLLLDLLQKELADCSSSDSSLLQEVKRAGLTCEQLHQDGETLQELLQHSLMMLDLSGLPQFWVSAQSAAASLTTPPAETENIHDAHTGKAGLDREPLAEADPPEQPYCPASFAWEFITRMQGQLFRHRKFVLPYVARPHAANVLPHHN
ncbi:hypothetical protein cyc_09215 [Cyclospora cayetanensis]|uniref:Uncharacterized protein n=1 Tax=Cyclospora cayetanensis TaxID=88456 RepID=A0A1D3CSU5_9EIME|nr:hypothetical protein cyc_09215 [Cyclospora cayetanensis]